MNIPNFNLYDTLFDNEDQHHTNNIGLDIVNSMYNSLNTDNICRYHDINSYKSTIPVNCLDYLNLVQVNARSLNKNYDNLITFLKTLPKLPDILCISETWLKPNTAPFHEINGFKSYHTHRPDGYGGVAIYVNSNISSVPLNDYCICNDNVELCTVEIKINSSSYIISSLYRPHSKHLKVNEFTVFMDNLLSQSIFTDNNSIISGDFNINLLEHSTNSPTNNFLTTMQSLNYFPHISRPTRFPEDNSTASPSLLDHIWTNFTAPSSTGIFLSPLSDHLPVFLNLPFFERLNEYRKYPLG